MATDTNLNVNVSVNAKELQALMTQLKLLDTSTRQNAVSGELYTKVAKDIESQVNKLSLTTKDFAGAQQALFLSGERVRNGFTSMSGSLLNVQKGMNTANQTLIGFSQGMQDASQFSMGFNQGLRGIANNIQQTSQMMALLVVQSGGVGGAFKNLVTQLKGTGGMLIGLASVTTALQVLPELFKNVNVAAKEAADQGLRDFTEVLGKLSVDVKESAYKRVEELLKQDKDELSAIQKRIIQQYVDAGLSVSEARKNVLIGGTPETKEIEARISRFEIYLNKNKEAIQIAKDLKKAEEDRLKIFGQSYPIPDAELNYVKQKKEIIDLEKQEEDAWWERERKRIARLYGGELAPRGTSMFGKQKTSLFGDTPQLRGAKISTFNLGGGNLDEEKKALKDSAHQYDMLLFDPIKQGFSDINSAIRTQLFGTLQELQAKFGAVGASIVQALESVIAKLIETAMLAAIVSIATGGTLDFGTVFGLLSKGTSAGSIISDPSGVVSASGSNRMVSQSSNRLANNMIGSGGMQTIRIVGETKLKNDHILVSYNRASFMENSSKV